MLLSPGHSPWLQTNIYPPTAEKSYCPLSSTSPNFKSSPAPKLALFLHTVCGTDPGASHPILYYFLSPPFSLALPPPPQPLASWFCSPFCTPLPFINAGPYVSLEVLRWSLSQPGLSATLHQSTLATAI